MYYNSAVASKIPVVVPVGVTRFPGPSGTSWPLCYLGCLVQVCIYSELIYSVTELIYSVTCWLSTVINAVASTLQAGDVSEEAK